MLQQHGTGHHSLYHPGAAGDAAAYVEANPANAPDERTAAADAGNPGPVQRRPLPHFPGNHAPLPGVGRQPGGMPWPPGRAASHSYWAFPRSDSDPLHQARRPGGAVAKALFMDYLRADSFGRPPQRQVPVAEPGGAGPFTHNFAHPGGCFHVGPAEDDHDPVPGPQAAVQPDHDALDDSNFPGILLTAVAQRFAALLDSFKCNRRGYPVFHHRLGPAVPVDSQVSPGSNSADSIRRERVGFRGDR